MACWDFLSPQSCRHFLKSLLKMTQEDLKVEKNKRGRKWNYVRLTDPVSLKTVARASVAWGDKQYFYSSLNGMPVHCRVPPPPPPRSSALISPVLVVYDAASVTNIWSVSRDFNNLLSVSIGTLGWRETLRVKWPGPRLQLELRSLHPELTALTNRTLRLKLRQKEQKNN